MLINNENDNEEHTAIKNSSLDYCSDWEKVLGNKSWNKFAVIVEFLK